MQRQPSFPQFSLAELFSCVSACAVPLAFTSTLGVACSLFLVTTAVALAARQGMLAILLLFAASIAADVRAGTADYAGSDAATWRQGYVAIVATIVSGWYVLGRSQAWQRAQKLWSRVRCVAR